MPIQRKVIHSSSSAMTEQEIAKVFEVLRLQTDEERQAATFDLLQSKSQPEIYVTFSTHTGVQAPIDLDSACLPSATS